MSAIEEQSLRHAGKKQADILIMEDDPATEAHLRFLLGKMGCHVLSVVSSAETVWEKVRVHRPDLVLMDRMLEERKNGIRMADRMYREYHIPVVYIAPYADDDILIRKECTRPFEQIRRPIRPGKLRIAVEMALDRQGSGKRLREEKTEFRTDLEQAFLELSGTILRVLENRDPYTAGHQKRVAALALLVGDRAGLKGERLNELRIGGLLHDIGKIDIPIDILAKPGCLTETEFRMIQSHVQIGYDIMKDARFPWNIQDIVLNHHEKLDGTGYPNGIGGEKISTNVRIITVCDVVEAMSTLRPYKTARTRMEVVDELHGGRGIRYDKDIVDIVVDLIKTEAYNPWEEDKKIRTDDMRGKNERGYQSRHSRL